MDKVEKEYIYTDSSDVEHKIHFHENSFDFAQKDKSIHDTKFLTKPTTFLKDAFKRFCKNKSSVAGAIILGILLLGSIIIPLADPYDITTQHPSETFLEPKLFPSGTGFRDGTKRMTNIPVDYQTITTDDNGVMYGYPFEAQYPKRCVSNLSPVRSGYVSQTGSSVEGGFVRLYNGVQFFAEPDDEALENTNLAYSSSSYQLTSEELNSENVSLTFTFLDEEIEGYPEGEYFQILLNYSGYTLATEETPSAEASYSTILKDFRENENYNRTSYQDATGATVNLKVLSFNDLYKSIRENEEIDLTQPIKINVELKLSSNVNATSSLFIKSIELKNGETLNNQISYTDANDALLTGTGEPGYWSYVGPTISQTTPSEGEEGEAETQQISYGAYLYNGVTYVCDFTYDTYAKPYGIQTQSISKTDLQSYVEKGWLKEDIVSETTLNQMYTAYLMASTTGQSVSKALKQYLDANLTDLSATYLPIISIDDMSRSTVTSGGTSITTYRFTCTVYGYKYLGYTSEPIFLLGTDNYGYDMLKRVFTGLLTSLGLGILIFAICFSFGLIWGAICGYFGGNVDIILERFTDLLSGIPWIVIMTLCILNLGSNFGTFILAMCLTGWIGTSSLTRTQFYRFRDREYTLASRTLGANDVRLIFKHILPNAMGTIITSSVLMIPSVIFTEATISYLGLGFQDMQSLGVILSDNQTYLNTYTYLILFPSVIMALIMICFNLFGNGLRDAFNPSLKGSD